MLPSMPLISTPYKEDPSPLPTTRIPDMPCLLPDTQHDSGGTTGTLAVEQERPNSPTDVDVAIIEDLNKELELALPKAYETSLGNYFSSPSKKSSPLKLVNPILRKYNTHRQGKILKRSVSPMHNSSHHSAQTYPHSEHAETSRNLAESVPVDSEADLAALMVASSTVPRPPKGKQAPVNKKKRLKELRDAKTMLGLLAPDSEQYNAESAKNFAQAYYHKLEDRLEENGDSELFDHILQLLGEFEAGTTPVRDLYEGVVYSLHNYPDLAELFDLFLLPEQAMECGRFMEHLRLTKMKTFVRQLEIFFAKQPQQFRQILSTMTTLADRSSVTLEEVKAAVVPLLKGNSYLIDSFLFLFPESRPPDSLMTEFEEMDMDSDGGGESGDEERVTIPDRPDAYGTENCLCPCHGRSKEARHLHCLSCGIKFIHGRVYVHVGRTLRPAKVSFADETASQRRIYVKANRRARPPQQRNPHPSTGSSPTKTHHAVHSCEEAEDDLKSSSPRSCKVAKLRVVNNPTSKVRPNGSKPGCGNAFRNEPTEVPFGDSEVPTPVPSVTTTCQTETVTLTLLGSSDGKSPIEPTTEREMTVFVNEATCDDNISLDSDIDFYTCDSADDATSDASAAVARASLDSFGLARSPDLSRTDGDPVFPQDLFLPVTPVKFDNEKHSCIASPTEDKVVCVVVPAAVDADSSVLKTESTTDFLSTSLLLETFLMDPVTTFCAEPNTSKNSSATSVTSCAPVNTAVKSPSLISTIEKEDPATFIDPDVDSTITKGELNCDSSISSTQTIVPSIVSVLVNDCETLPLATSNLSTLNIPKGECLTFPGQTYESSTSICPTHDSLTLTDPRSTAISSNADCLTLLGQTIYPSTPVSSTADYLALSGQTNCPSTPIVSNTDCSTIMGQINDPLIVQSAEKFTLPIQMNDQSTSIGTNSDCLTLYRGTNDSSTPTSLNTESVTLPGRTYDWPTSFGANNDCPTLKVDNSSPGKEESGCQDDHITPRLVGNGEAKSSPRPWTKEEDRLILVEVQLGLGMDVTFMNIKKGLPHRSMEEIRERFHMLMKILQEMAEPDKEDTKSTATSASV